MATGSDIGVARQRVDPVRLAVLLSTVLLALAGDLGIFLIAANETNASPYQERALLIIMFGRALCLLGVALASRTRWSLGIVLVGFLASVFGYADFVEW